MTRETLHMEDIAAPTSIISAQQASALTAKKAITIETISKSIAQNAENGMNNIRFFDIPIGVDVIQKLLELGFSISQTTGHYKENIFIVGW